MSNDVKREGLGGIPRPQESRNSQRCDCLSTDVLLGAVEFAQKRLSALSKSLGDKPYLDGDRFTAGDLMMTTVLRIPKHNRHRHQRPAAGGVYRTLHGETGLQTRLRCADWGFQGRRIGRVPISYGATAGWTTIVPTIPKPQCGMQK